MTNGGAGGDGKERQKGAAPTWTDEEKFWRAVRQAGLMFVDAIETHRLARHVETRTAEIRKHLRSYQQAYMFPPIAAEDVRERIAELTAAKVLELATKAECDEL